MYLYLHVRMHVLHVHVHVLCIPVHEVTGVGFGRIGIPGEAQWYGVVVTGHRWVSEVLVVIVVMVNPGLHLLVVGDTSVVGC